MLVKGIKKEKEPRKDGCCQELLAWRSRIRRRDADWASDAPSSTSASASIIKHLLLLRSKQIGTGVKPMLNGLEVERQAPTPTVALAFISDFSIWNLCAAICQTVFLCII